MTGRDDVIYLDHAATTPLDAAVFAEMKPFFDTQYGNASSIYGLGQESRGALDRARADVARVLGCHPSEIIFTGGATESDNLALAGVAWAARLAAPESHTPHIVTTAIEHSAILESARWLKRQGFAITVVPVNAQGTVSVDAIEAALRPETCLVSVMYANNEVGSIQPIAEIGALLRGQGIVFHSDAVQAAGSLPIDVQSLNVDFMSLSSHKFYGPKGVGLLYTRKGTRFAPTQLGGGQESGRRGGTENIPGIVGFAASLQRADAMRDAYASHCARLRDRLVVGLQNAIDGVTLNGPTDAKRRLPNSANLRCDGVQGETVLLNLDMEGVAASAGSACTAGKAEPSHVLEAMGLTEAATRSSVRFTVGRSNTDAQIDDAIEIIAETVERIRALGVPT